ncbi:hypothetical protein O6H91_Y274600 [Diphasiastrum complanatum]|nr:hypothetical protein O6H91_Y274600 [Diphasiastrum complanatum]KAJ7294165.1 hypothetical protein O6H91_Y274600 [Diphasiastrum complanatum]
MSKRLREVASREANQLWNDLVSDKPLLPFLVPVFLLAWGIERWIVPLSNWVPLVVCVWATIEYGKHQRKQAVEELNNKWKRHFLCTQPTTPIEPCEWLNKLLMYVWPNFLEPKLSKKMLSLVQKRIKEKRPKPIQSVEVQDFTLGTAPPILGLQKTYWSTEGGQQVLHMGFEWDTNEMSLLLAAKLGVPFKGKVARIIINSIHIKGDIRLTPILDGQGLLYSFECTPEVRLGIAFGSGNQTLPATELPVVSSWLEKLLIETLNRTLVEPRRKCFSLPPVDYKKHAVGGTLSVTIVKARNLTRVTSGSKSSLGEKRSFSSGTNHQTGSGSYGVRGAFVELTLDELIRKSKASEENGMSPTWNETIEMAFHGNSGTLHLNLYGRGSNHMKVDFLGTCQVKMKYVDDDSTTFWAVGPKSGVIAERAEYVGQEVTMTVPVEGTAGEVIVRLTMKEWLFHDSSKPLASDTSMEHQNTLGSWPVLPSRTGRKLKVIVLEGRNLAPKDRTGKSDPYLRIQYGKVIRKTKAIAQTLNPTWNESFEFQEMSDEDYLKLKCYDQDFFTNDENMGIARINLQILEVGVAKDVWVPLEKIETGEIHLKIELLPQDLDSDGSQRFSDDNGALQKGGAIELVVMEARDLVAADWGGTSDPYVTVRYGNIKKRTKVVYKTLDPQWNETLKFLDDGSPLGLHVKDYNAILRPSSIGHCEVEYQQMPLDRTVDKWIRLHGVNKGEIHIQVTRRGFQKQKPTACDKPAGQPRQNMRLQNILTKVHTVVRKARELAEEEEKEELLSNIEELEAAEHERNTYILQLEKEKECLQSKVEELEGIMKSEVPQKAP